MAFDASNLFGHSPGSNEFQMGAEKDSEEKGLATQISNISAIRTHVFEAPEWIRNLTSEQRSAVEAKLVRKIDLRLLPMIILYVRFSYYISFSFE